MRKKLGKHCYCNLHYLSLGLKELFLLPEMGLQTMFNWWTKCRGPSKLPTRYVIKGVLIFNICSFQQQASNTQSNTLDVSTQI